MLNNAAGALITPVQKPTWPAISLLCSWRAFLAKLLQAVVNMLHRTCRLSKLVQQSLISAPVFAQDAIVLPSSSSFCRPFSNLPNDYANVKVVMPVRTAKKLEPSHQQSNAEGQTSVLNTVPGASSSSTLHQGAQAGDQQQQHSRQPSFVSQQDEHDCTRILRLLTAS
jgi:hypothetical protein